MKKIFLPLVFLFALLLASCSGTADSASTTSTNSDAYISPNLETTSLDHAAVQTGPFSPAVLFYKFWISHTSRQGAARDARRANLQSHSIDFQPITDHEISTLQLADSQVFSKSACA